MGKVLTKILSSNLPRSLCLRKRTSLIDLIYLRQNAGHVKDLGVQVRQVSHDEYEDGLDHANLMGEPRDETSAEAPYHADYRAADRHHEERSQSRQHVRVKYFRRSYLVVRLEHMVQHLRVIKWPQLIQLFALSWLRDPARCHRVD